MGIRCGSQVLLCEYPISLDTYANCSHGCRYCFAQTHAGFDNVKPLRCAESLRRFAAGGRTQTTNWCDFDIPLHWGGMSDPFQPAERRYGASLDLLKVFRETQYPFIVSTKGELITEDPYISLLADCNAVVQVSMCCPSYDKMEPGAPSFERRLEMCRQLSKACKRVIARVQPYITDVRREFIEQIPKIAEAGVHGITLEGMKFKRKKPGLVKVRGDWCYPERVLEQHYRQIKKRAHESGLAFYCAENRLRALGDSTSCCGCGDMEGFRGNKFNLVSIAAGGGVPSPTEAMREKGTAMCFKALHQTTLASNELKGRSFEEQMMAEGAGFCL